MIDNLSQTNCDSLPQVALSFMNTVHCEELSLVTELLAQLQACTGHETVDARLQRWVDHTRAHFAREEGLMQQYEFFAYPMHKMEHERALLQLLQVQQHWLEQHDGRALAHYITEDWRPWLDQHIASMDFVTARFLNQFDPQVEL